jgi:hypothetical protein
VVTAAGSVATLEARDGVVGANFFGPEQINEEHGHTYRCGHWRPLSAAERALVAALRVHVLTVETPQWERTVRIYTDRAAAEQAVIDLYVAQLPAKFADQVRAIGYEAARVCLIGDHCFGITLDDCEIGGA